MSRSTATLDAVDRGFLRRLTERSQARAAAVIDEPMAAAPVPEGPTGDAVAKAPVATGRPESAGCRPQDPGPAAPLVERLLYEAPQAWDAIAERVEDAHRRGASVIAVAGGRRGEGRTTVVQCLAKTLAARGRHVEVHDRAPVDGAHLFGGDRGPIVLVDAGVWFPGGPIRRSSLERMSLGCQAAILVRRADLPECAARGNAIESIGLKLLGEVLTMVPAGSIAAAVS